MVQGLLAQDKLSKGDEELLHAFQQQEQDVGMLGFCSVVISRVYRVMSCGV